MDVDPIALWRFQIISPLLAATGPRGTRLRLLREICARTHEHPLRGPTRLGTRTVQTWLYDYLRLGLAGLAPRPRKDQGSCRTIDAVLATLIEELVRAHPHLDGPALAKELRAQGCDALPSLSTIYRFKRRRGLDRLTTPPRADHRAYAFDLAGDCWQGDIMVGPALAQPNGSRRTAYLFAILDDATRLICHAQFYYEQHLASLRDCLKQAFLKRSLPRRLYFDNGKVFRSQALLRLCATLGIHLIHSRPYRPQGRAKLERWFGTVRESFLARLDIKTLVHIDQLNRLLFAWIEGDYHVAAHRGIDGETPLARWTRLGQGLRPLPRDVDLDRLFLDVAKRRVARDGTLSILHRRFEAGPCYIGQKVTVRFDPFDLRCIWIGELEKDLVQIFPVDLSGNRRIRRNPPVDPPKPPDIRLKGLDDLADRIDLSRDPQE